MSHLRIVTTTEEEIEEILRILRELIWRRYSQSLQDAA